MHVRHLLGELGVQGDLPVLANIVLAPLEASVLKREIEVDGFGLDRLHQAWSDAVRRIVGVSADPNALVQSDEPVQLDQPV